MLAKLNIATGFFNPQVKKLAMQPTVGKKTYINLGGAGDCGFRSIAAGIIDNFLSEQQQDALLRPRKNKNQKLIKALMEAYFKLFPEQLPAYRSLTAEAQFERLIKTPNMGPLVVRLADVIRQIAVDEMVRYPVKYRGAFVANHEGTSPAEMRKAQTYIDETTIAAAANALDLPIDVSVVSNNKEVPAALHYGPSEQNGTQGVQIQLQLPAQHYVPKLKLTERFSAVKDTPTSSLPNIEKQGEHDPELSEILELIKEDNARLEQEYDKQVNRLQIMLSEKEISKQELLDIYIKGIPNSGYLSRVHYVGLENGNQAFFDEIIRAQKGEKVITLDKAGHEEQVLIALVDAIARAICIGHIPETVLDEKESKTLR